VVGVEEKGEGGNAESGADLPKAVADRAAGGEALAGEPGDAAEGGEAEPDPGAGEQRGGEKAGGVSAVPIRLEGEEQGAGGEGKRAGDGDRPLAEAVGEPAADGRAQRGHERAGDGDAVWGAETRFSCRQAVFVDQSAESISSLDTV
jgi:hypothetical protein